MTVLIKNELIKLNKKNSTWIMLGILVALTFAMAYLVSLGSSDYAANDVFETLSQMTSVLNLVVVIVAASSLAEEFSRGTIKFLLIRPFSRSQIVAAKYLACLLFGLFGTAVLFLVSLLSSNLFLTTQSPLVESVWMPGWSSLAVALAYAATNLLLIVLYLAITIFISAVMRSQSLAVAIGIGALFGSSVVNLLLAFPMQNHSWLKWNMFNMLNIKDKLSEFSGTSSLPANLNLYLNYWQMAAGLLVYGLIFYLLTIFFFKKRDVALN
ncbi:ABC transporter permease [Enterococcus sp. LJL90]